MAGGGNSGGQRLLDIKKIAKPNNPSYPPTGSGNKKIEKESRAELKMSTVSPAVLTIGVRIKQTEKVEQFRITGKNGQQLVLTPAPPNETPAPDPIADDMKAAFGAAADERWVAYTTSEYKPATFGKKFDTKLVLSPFDCHPNGVRTLLVVSTPRGTSYANGHYVYGVSVLPGENSKGHPIDIAVAPAPEVPAAKPAKKPAAKPAKKPAKGKWKPKRGKKRR